MIIFFSGAALTAQFYHLRDWFYRLKYYSLERKMNLHIQRGEFERQATSFLFKITDMDKPWIDFLHDSYYRPKSSFKGDIVLWQEHITKKDYKKAYDLIKNSEPYLPGQYIELWLLKTLKVHLKDIEEENELRRTLRRVPSKFFDNNDFLEIYAIKLSLFTLNKEALSAVSKISAELIDENIEKALWFWMRNDSAFWFKQLSLLWSYQQVLSPSANVLMVKLAISTDFIGQARTYLEKISPSSDRFYLEHILSLQADKRLDVLTGIESWKKS